MFKYGVPYEQDEIENISSSNTYSYTWETDIPTIYYEISYRDWYPDYSDSPIYISYGYIKKNDFTAFGWYRIVLGVIVFIYLFLIGDPIINN